MNSNGIISSPVNFKADVATVLGTSSTNESALCTSSNINKWSLYKPVRYAKSSGMTDTDFFACDFGYTIQSYNNYPAMRQHVTDSWEYLKPTGGASSPYRIGDFRDYDHNATAPFILTLTNGNPELGNNCRISVPTDITWLTNWNTWSDYQGTSIQYLNCGFYVPDVGYYPLTDTNQGLSISDLDISKLNFEVTQGYFTVGRTYQVYLILTSWDGLNGARQWYNPTENEGGLWWVLATDKPLSFTVQKATTPASFLSVTGSGTATMQEQSGYYTWTNVNLSISVSCSDDYFYSTNGTVYIDVIIGNHYPGTGTSTEEKTIATLTLTNVGAGYSTTRSIAASSFNLLNSKEDSVNADVEIDFVVNGQTYSRTSFITITSY